MNYVSADGQVIPNLIFYTEVTAQTDGEQIHVQAVPSDSCAVIIAAKTLPPLPEGYTFLLYTATKVPSSSGLAIQGNILRANGTIGTDGMAGAFTPSTGDIVVGGTTYGKLIAGMTYCVYQIEIPTE